jgi:hypothetical protein
LKNTCTAGKKKNESIKGVLTNKFLLLALAFYYSNVQPRRIPVAAIMKSQRTENRKERK